MERKALGKGLEALISGFAQKGREELTRPAGGHAIQEIDIHKIVPNRYQPRRVYAEEGLKELSDSIKEKGVIQPVILRKADDSGYELIAGERRLRAAQMAGLKTIPAIIKEATTSELLELALIENIQREDLNPIEEANAYERLIKEFKLTQEEVAKRVGKPRSSVTNYLRLLTLPEEIKRDLAAGVLSTGHAKAILTLNKEIEQLKARNAIIRRGLSVRGAEVLVKGLKEHPLKRKKRNIDHELIALEERLKRTFGTQVRVHHKSRGGWITIEYYSRKDLDRILDLILD